MSNLKRRTRMMIATSRLNRATVKGKEDRSRLASTYKKLRELHPHAARRMHRGAAVTAAKRRLKGRQPHTSVPGEKMSKGILSYVGN